MKFKDLSGMVLWGITVLSEHETRNEKIYWKCICSCGEEWWVPGGGILSGNTKSCGHCKNKYEIILEYSGAYALVELSNGQWTKIDVEDWDRIKKFKWYAVYSKKMKSFYARTTIYPETGKRSLFMHREVMWVSDPKIQIDHIYHDTLDNRKSKLRVATNSQNRMNSKVSSKNTSGYTGISGTDKGSGNLYWTVSHRVNGKRYCKHFPRTDLGLQQAIAFRKEMVEKYYKEFAYKTA
jgi:hypothetical protein